MAYEHPGGGALDYCPCRYGRSKLLFRGPRRRLTGPYVAALGGTETYGKFVARPWPVLLEEGLGLPVPNFGCVNAGVDVFLSEPQVVEIAAAARVAVVQLMGPQNMSNRFYMVHPRRNDRFLRASAAMRSLYPEVDFTEFNFTRHMLTALRDRYPARFDLLAQELRSAWVARGHSLLERIGARVALLWVGPKGSGGTADPVPLDAAMVAELGSLALETVRVEVSAAARAAGTEGMWFGQLEQAAAAEMPGPMVHAEVAEALMPVLRGLL
ncbi:DUF6473 family protein [Phaeovulum sp.]|uniref:DUF6473 family protein n=1 Tax=Phaeovulum sp. TaxID=2934796 RepID=UPI002730F7F3|nr:DUF6473 family protein [Phaeovulum sp.]MDP1669363.1 DUF6473 family protein [Phaeovulum sp.]MDZ4119639.1 DUF6473 family protein [Phaeovulum sp.]